MTTAPRLNQLIKPSSKCEQLAVKVFNSVVPDQKRGQGAKLGLAYSNKTSIFSQTASKLSNVPTTTFQEMQDIASSYPDHKEPTTKLECKANSYI